MLTVSADRHLSDIDRHLVERRLRAYWDLPTRHDIDKWMAFLAEDFVYIGQTWVGLPVKIRREGREGFREFTKHISSLVEYLETSVVELVVDGQQAAASRRLKLRARGTGRIGELSVCSFVRFRNGEIVEISDHVDSTAMARLLSD
ncbi:MAG: nuclear transport factor 2 family protein [Rhodoblastus sp.]